MAACTLTSSILLASTEADLLAHVAKCHKNELMRIYRLGLVCRCEWSDDEGYGLRTASCIDGEIKVGFAKCTHTDEGTLPLAVCVVLLARLWPKDYAEPALDEKASDAVTRQACYAARMRRMKRRRSLWHPGDKQKSDIDGTAMIEGIAVSRSRNGSLVEHGVQTIRN